MSRTTSVPLKARPRHKARRTNARQVKLKGSPLKLFLKPQSIAVIGASRTPESVGHAIFSNLVAEFKGPVYPINPNADEILSVRCHAKVEDIPDTPDLAVLIVPAVAVPAVLEGCGKKGIKAALVISAGFKEIGPQGARLESEAMAVARRHGMRLVGPNCLGLINTDPKVRLNATFGRTMPKTGNIAFISQSGALCTAVLDYAKAQNIGFSKFISMGNKADVNELGFLMALKDDPQTDVILMYLEDIHNGRAFIDLAREITGESKKRIPILAIKSGRTQEGAQAAQSHTGSLMGTDEVYDAIFAQSGVLRVETVEELFNYAIAFSRQPLPKGNRVAIVTNAGGPGIMATDASVRSGLKLARFSNETRAALKGALPPTANIHNPVDVIGDARHDRYQAALDQVFQDPGVDAVLTILTPQAMTDIEEIAHVVGRAAQKKSKPMIACFMGISDVSKGRDILEDYRVPHYTFPESAVRALASLHRYAEWVGRQRTEFIKFRVHSGAARRIISGARRDGRRLLYDWEAIAVLKAYGFPVGRSAFARSEGEAVRAAHAVRYPVVLKIVSPDISHKFDVGGVRLNVTGPEELRRVYREMVSTVKKRQPGARIRGVHVQEMAPRGREVILGLKRDPLFGPLLLFGLGGIYVEAFKDVTFRVAPIRALGAPRMIRGIRAYPLLEGIRGEKGADQEALAQSILRLSQFAMEIPEISELDINPMVVYEKGSGCRVLDARMVIADKE